MKRLLVWSERRWDRHTVEHEEAGDGENGRDRRPGHRDWPDGCGAHDVDPKTECCGCTQGVSVVY